MAPALPHRFDASFLRSFPFPSETSEFDRSAASTERTVDSSVRVVKEVSMIPASKVVCMLACGFLLGIAQGNAIAQTGNHPNGDAEARIGGQAGQPYDQMTEQHASVQSRHRANGDAKARMGGQAGQPYDHMKHQQPSPPAESHQKGDAETRIGGQAGEGYSPSQLEE